MVKRMLIDATHSEETRVVVVNGTRLESFDVETSTKKQNKGNIYLAKIVRVEPSLQAAFVDYGGGRHGFLAFSEIHPDYYQIPVADRQALIAEQQAEAAREAAEQEAADNGEDVETLGGDESEEEPATRTRQRSIRNYKIQEVIKRRQIMLVQVVKEERGNKGAALTTYISLAGRYCVLMPNTARGGGVSRKITSAIDRRRLKAIMSDLDVPGGMAVILRTAGAERNKTEIKRDYDYLIRTWNQIRETTLASRAPALIHEEASLIRRAIRDVYSADLEEVLVEGEEGYRLAKDFMKTLTPSHAKKVQRYRDPIMPLFHRYQVDSQLDAMHSPVVQLRSGGYIVINQTEALVAIDVNSGRATKERHIEETALKTNLEAAEEIARQLRLRDLAGLIVIDFIDMEESRNNASVEKRLKEALKSDRARIQMGRISAFGLLELSRQRLRPSLMETSFTACPHCGGTGMIRSTESTSVHILRIIEEEGVRQRSTEVTVTVHPTVALYILNYKRQALEDIERRYGIKVYIQGDESLIPPDHRMERVKGDRKEEFRPAVDYAAPVDDEDDDEDEDAAEAEDTGPDAAEAEAEAPVAAAAEPARAAAQPAAEGGEDDGDNGKTRRRRRRRRRGKRNGETETQGEADAEAVALDEQFAEEGDGDDDADGEDTEAEGEGEGDADEGADEGADLDAVEGESEADAEKRRRRRARRRGRRRRKGGAGEGDEPAVAAAAAVTVEPEVAVADEDEGGALVAPVEDDAEAAPAAEEAPARKPRRRRTKADADATETAEAADAVPVADGRTARTSGRPRAAPADEAVTPELAEAVAEAEQPVEATPAEQPEPAAAPQPEPEAAPAAPEPAASAEPEQPPQPPRRGWWEHSL
ncbi:ribonuclease E/G [Caenispirillum bisanense]|uniref:Rne/Rng family ribonuclease n=1 Tax=Caenispirillum bisanense TaxID=414052 RepID=UPI0031E07377